MDLKLLDAEATLAERHAVDHALGPPSSGWVGGRREAGIDGRLAIGGHHAAQAERHRLLPALLSVQEHVGWISPGALSYVCQRLDAPPAEVYGVATFYALLSTEPRPPRVVHVCEDLACRCRGSDELIAALEQAAGPEGTGEGVDLVPLAVPRPVRPGARGAPDGRGRAAARAGAGAGDRSTRCARCSTATTPSARRPTRSRSSATRRCGCCAASAAVDPESLDDYRARGGYAALRRAFELGREGVIREVKDSKLQGRGGAAFPTGVKWDAVARQPARPHYLVCNADESEPGTFKDRVLIEGDPYALIESMTIAAYATDAGRGYVYLRGEYPDAHRILQHAIDEARRRGFLGEDVLGQGFAFELEIRKGGGAYICGEETAIFNSIEGQRGEPRNKPPFPVVAGLFGKPTVVNNVETLVNVLDVILESGAGLRRHRHRGLDRHQAVLPVAATSSARACTRSSSAPRCASCSSWPAGSPTAGRCRPCSWAAPRAAS